MHRILVVHGSWGIMRSAFFPGETILKKGPYMGEKIGNCSSGYGLLAHSSSVHLLAPLGNPSSVLTGLLNLCPGALSRIRTLNIDEGRAGLCVCGRLNSITDFFSQVWTPLIVIKTYCRFKKRRFWETQIRGGHLLYNLAP